MDYTLRRTLAPTENQLERTVAILIQVIAKPSHVQHVKIKPFKVRAKNAAHWHFSVEEGVRALSDDSTACGFEYSEAGVAIRNLVMTISVEAGGSHD